MSRSIDPPEMYYCWGENAPFDPLTGENVLVSAGVAWGRGDGEFRLNIPDAGEIFLDSGGFQAATQWERYPYDPPELFEFAEDIGARYVAGMDVACEDRDVLLDIESTKVDPGPVRDRLERSLIQQRRCDSYYKSGDYDFQLVPVVQGRTVDEYEMFMDWMMETGLDQYPYLAIGTVCKRGSPSEIFEVLTKVRRRWPNKDIHLFGATKLIWKQRRFWGLFESSDTKAWTFNPPGTDRRFCKNKAEKYDAFESYKADIESIKREMRGQATLTTDGGHSIPVKENAERGSR